MKNAIVLRIAYEVCFLLAVVSGGFSCGGQLWLLLAFLAALVLMGFVCVRLENAVLRTLAALVPAAAIFFASGTALIIALCIAEIYFLLVMVQGSFEAEYLTVQSVFTVMAVLLFIFLFTFIARSVTMNESADRGLLVFAFLFFTLGIITLRVLRLRLSVDRRSGIMNATVVFVPAFGGILASVVLFYFLKYVGPYIAYPFALLIEWLFGLTARDFQPRRPESLQIDASPVHLPGTYTNTQSARDLLSDTKDDKMLTVVDLRIEDTPLQLICGIAVVAVILVLILLYVRKHKKADASEAEFDIADTVGERLFRRRNTKPQNNAEKLRGVYRDYLFYLKLRGQEIESGDTSREILDGSKLLGGEPAETLRELYIRARYANADDISDDDLKLAEDCLRRIRDENTP